MPDENLCPGGLASDPDDFCIKQRGDWLAFAFARTHSWPEAEEAVSHVVQKIYAYHEQHKRLCPGEYDPVAWSKTVISDYLIDQYRRSTAKRRHSRALIVPAGDIAEDIIDQILARNALAFVASLDGRDRIIAVMRWVDGMEPKEIAGRLGVKSSTVRTSLYRITKKMRTQLGVAEPRKILREEST